MMQPENQKVLAAIVTFNGVETIRETLSALQEQHRPPDAFLIIDNASKDATLEVIHQLKINNLKIKKLNKNEGVAAAYNIALEEALKNNFNWLWLFDQDSVCQPDCLEKLLTEAEIIKSSGISPAALFPSHYLKSHPDHLLPPWKWNGREMVDIIKPENPFKNHTSVHTSMTSGALYNLSLIRNEQGFRKDFFIDFVDHEYHMRLVNRGYKLFWVNNARINHDLGKTKVNAVGQTINYHEPWRYYFIGRNMFSCYLKWGGLKAVRRLWKVSKRQLISYRSLAGVNHKLIWKYFNLGIRDSVISRIYKMNPPKTISSSIQ
jgi:rhamnosyltransferase